MVGALWSLPLSTWVLLASRWDAIPRRELLPVEGAEYKHWRTGAMMWEPWSHAKDLSEPFMVLGEGHCKNTMGYIYYQKSLAFRKKCMYICSVGMGQFFFLCY